jgi:uncharacterized protein YkwD
LSAVTQTSGSKRLVTLAISVLAGVAVLALASAPVDAGQTGCRNAHLHPTAKNVAAVDKTILCLVDQVRRAHHLRALHFNGELGAVASSQVLSMVHGDYFSDVSPSGQTAMSLVASSGYQARAESVAVGTDIGWGTSSYATPAHIVAAWMASPPHRANILSATYLDAGPAVVPAVPGVLRVGKRGATYEFVFGVRRF